MNDYQTRRANLVGRRTEVWNAGKNLLSAAGDNRLTKEERALFEQYNAKLDELDAEITALEERHERAENGAAAYRDMASKGIRVEGRTISAPGAFRADAPNAYGTWAVQELRTTGQDAKIIGYEARDNHLSTDFTGLGVPERFDQFIRLLQPLTAALASGVRVLQLGQGFNSYMIPIVDAAQAANWVAENADTTSAGFAAHGLTVNLSKVAGYTAVTNETLSDLAPSVLEEVAITLLRSIAIKIDAAFFGKTGTNAPNGIGNLTYATTATAGSAVEVANGTGTAGAALANLDKVSSAVQYLVAQGVDPADLVMAMRPEVWYGLTRVKAFTGSITSNAPLVGQDVANTADRRLLGVPVFLSNQISATQTLTGGVVSAETGGATTSIYLYDRNRVFVPMRSSGSDGQPMLLVNPYDQAQYDRTSIRAVTRVGFGFGRPESVARISGVTVTGW
jgi:HK97 family phage major capsid protein